MADLFELLIFLGVVFLSLLASGKRKKKPGAQARPPTARRPEARASTPASRPPQPAAERPAVETASRQAGVEDLLDILRGRLPMPEPATRPTPQPVPEDIDDEAVSLEDVNFDRATAHRDFHDKYVADSSPITERPRQEPRHKYRLTPRTAREAVVWTAIFTRPKGME